MREAIRHFLRIAAAAAVTGTVAAVAVHAAWEWMMNFVFIGLGAALVFGIFTAVLAPWRRTRAIAAVMARCATVAILAIPAAWIAGRGVFAFDLWCAKRYVEARLVPRLESFHAARGRYPERYMRFWLYPPNDAPWLIRNFSYFSDGRSYTLSVMDPMVCGQRTWYSSAARQWNETYAPCYY